MTSSAGRSFKFFGPLLKNSKGRAVENLNTLLDIFEFADNGFLGSLECVWILSVATMNVGLEYEFTALSHSKWYLNISI